MNKKYSIPEFIKYLNIDSSKNEDIHIVWYDNQSEIRLQSKPINIDFYLLAIKLDFDKNLDFGQTGFDKADSYLYFDSPDKTLEWDLKQSMSGYNILISKRLFTKYAKDYNFMHYKNHEALFVTKEEEGVLLDLFQKAYTEYNQENFSKEILLSYSTLILSYINTFYKRQFDTRGKLYNKIVSDFYKHLEDYYDHHKDITKLPSVAFFADKSNLSSNYFGDVIKHFTGNSPQEHIHQHVLQIAKNKLRQSELTISEIAYSLGFEYPTYFTRFFRKETGITPSVFRDQ
ncbi:helix-turn-helix domain-containing protein [Rapidithrix thailandica]|uniref:Helix-turn-helix domain-containing protein n=1 Tax=Rapidithrix thailandica TaxID=413964 RepID=A0AAW9RZY6_9BACT